VVAPCGLWLYIDVSEKRAAFIFNADDEGSVTAQKNDLAIFTAVKASNLTPCLLFWLQSLQTNI